MDPPPQGSLPKTQISQSNSKTPSLDYLLDELLTEILVRMPVDLVHRCKTISKRWLSLISTPEFAKRYVLHKPHCQHHMLTHYYHSPDPDVVADVVDWIASEKTPPLLKPFSFDFLPINPKKFEQHRIDLVPTFVHLAGSCNGLLLCSAQPKGRGKRRIYYICNPVTKTWVLLPIPPASGKFVRFVEERAGLVCDDDDKGRYKVIIFPKRLSNSMMSTVKILSFCCESGNWSEIDAELPQGLRWSAYTSDMISYNGMLYWLDRGGIFKYDPFNKPDKLELINFPPDMKEFSRHVCIGIVEGKIRLSHLYNTPTHVDLWELEDFCKLKWRKLHYQLCTLDEDILSRGGFMHFYVNWISEVDGDIIYIPEPGSILLYNFNSRVLKSLWYMDTNDGKHRFIINLVPMALPRWPTPVPDIKSEAQVSIN